MRWPFAARNARSVRSGATNSPPTTAVRLIIHKKGVLQPERSSQAPISDSPARSVP
ncbi:hypothetical protein OV079_34785 [Nannocystis pusilla]|uniref:Uncharacterized protein n=1 Tax=Nannocystis pusilla TaxID=889268 RepID=A0A9X3J124_9BACT|nr:hypothetical protein [Nannocystis pusilla]MCY1010645.1 hypothetical protein [Nannocystis pusilla]